MLHVLRINLHILIIEVRMIIFALKLTFYKSAEAHLCLLLNYKLSSKQFYVA